jgi:hypothetical protein
VRDFLARLPGVVSEGGIGRMKDEGALGFLMDLGVLKRLLRVLKMRVQRQLKSMGIFVPF